jgi:hypothetical protein
LIEQRARLLAQTLMSDLQKIPGVKLWTDPKPAAFGGHRHLPARQS